MQQAGTQRLLKYPPFSAKARRAKFALRSPPALCTPLNGRKDKSPYYQLAVVIVPTVTVVVPKICHPRQPLNLPKSLRMISNRVGGDGPVIS